MNQHQVYQRIDEIPKDIPVKGPVYRNGRHVTYDCLESEHHGKTGFINNILYAPNVDHYYQRIRVNTGNYNFIESASRFWRS